MASNPRIDDLRKRLERDPGSRLFAQLAEELRKGGELEEAVALSLDGLQRHPNYPSARMTLGRCLLDKGDLMAARREFESVLKGAPDNILASRFLAECLEGLGDIEGAAAQQRAALRLSPGDPQALQRLADLEGKIAAGPTPAPAPEPSAVEEAGSSREAEAEPAPIPLASVDDDAFELERPYEAPAGDSARATPQVPMHPGAVPVPTEPGGIIEFEMSEATPPPAAETAVASEDGAPPEASAVWEPAPPTPQPEPVILAGPEAFGIRADRTPPAPVPAFREFEGEPPPPWVAPAPAPADPTPPSASAEIASSTLAELYFKQGFTDKAVEVYRQVLVREPGNDRARARLAELEGPEQRAPEPATVGAPSSPSQADARDARRAGLERAITGLEKMLASVRKE